MNLGVVWQGCSGLKGSEIAVRCYPRQPSTESIADTGESVPKVALSHDWQVSVGCWLAALVTLPCGPLHGAA